MLNYDFAAAFVACVIGDLNTVVDWRAIHDTNNGVPALTRRDTLAGAWQWIENLNGQGYGIFAVIAQLDGQGRKLANVQLLRANYVDLDSVSAASDYERAAAWSVAPSLAVQSSPGKFHVYWSTQYYTGAERFELIQRKLRQLFQGDPSIIDATRVMRVPGTLHQKNPDQPHLVTLWQLPSYGQRHAVETLEQSLSVVNLIDNHRETRRPLGDEEFAAPSLDWCRYALAHVDPNHMTRGEWISYTAAIKQAMWSVTSPETAFQVWSEWCAQYEHNDPAENLKQWNDLTETAVGWSSVVSRTPGLKAQLAFKGVQHDVPQQVTPEPPPVPTGQPAASGERDNFGPYLTHIEQQAYFDGCVFVANFGQIMTPSLRFMNSTQFNAQYGGKYFIVDMEGKKTNEAWSAATRSVLWTIPKVDHIRFVPSEPFGTILTDALGRKGVNTYKPIDREVRDGDVSPFLNHLAALVSDENDRRLFIEWLAHNAKYPGHKITWSPVIQSTEGAGKGVIKRIMQHVMGMPYVYYPKASELADSGSKFNAWLRRRLFILVDEIKVDDRRELIEILKPLISEIETEVQGKGADQDIEDNFANWLFFTNFKDAVPIGKNQRRFALIFSLLQTADDLIAWGMDEAYFTALYDWLDAGGAAITAKWLLNYPIARGAIPKRAPVTSSWAEAVQLSRSPVERMIAEAVEDGLNGFKNGWVSVDAVIARAKETGTVQRLTATTVGTVLEAMGYRLAGRTPRAYAQENMTSRLTVYSHGGSRDPALYGAAQGYE